MSQRKEGEIRFKMHIIHSFPTLICSINQLISSAHLAAHLVKKELNLRTWKKRNTEVLSREIR
jgi:hypothetical protein